MKLVDLKELIEDSKASIKEVIQMEHISVNYKELFGIITQLEDVMDFFNGFGDGFPSRL